jgi:hypothetical protein
MVRQLQTINTGINEKITTEVEEEQELIAGVTLQSIKRPNEDDDEAQSKKKKKSIMRKINLKEYGLES